MNCPSGRLLLSGLTIALAAAGHAQTTLLVSVDSAGQQANGVSWSPPAISADGTVVAFYSIASNLVPGDTNGWTFDVFVHDLASGQTSCVSVDQAGAVGNGQSVWPSLSGDGRFVAFNSTATNLVAGDTNDASDVFVRDRLTGVTTLVSVSTSGQQGNGGSYEASISADGRYVAFLSRATNLVAGDTNEVQDAFVHDRATGETRRVSVDSAGVEGNDTTYAPRIADGGRHVTFYSYADNLVPGDTNGFIDVFVHELDTGLTERVSVGAGGEEANEQSWTGGLSADGRLVAFLSVATNLLPDDGVGLMDVFVKDRATGAITRASVNSDGVAANSHSDDARISADGRYVTFVSWATNLVPVDTNEGWDVFVHDRVSGETVRASVDSGGAQANDFSWGPSLSADGRQVVFQSWATDLVEGDVNEQHDIFVRDFTQAPLGENYCGPAAKNSSGQSAAMRGWGSPLAAANDVTLEAVAMPPDQNGYFLLAQELGFVPFAGGSQGHLCLAGTIGRYRQEVLSTGSEGRFALTIDLTDVPLDPPGAIAAGETWYFQAWFRDVNPKPTSNFTDGLAVTFE